MKRVLFLTLMFFVWQSAASQNNFDKYFDNSSLRIDFALSGNSKWQAAALEQLRHEPIWSGPKNNLIDQFGYGGYYVKVYDAVSGALIYSRGLNTLFEEWRTTDEAVKEVQSWTNSIVVPYPKNLVEVEILAREREDMEFHSLLRFSVDPASIFIDRGKLHDSRVGKLHYSGDPNQKLDIVFIAEGYTEQEQDKFFKDAERFTDLLFSIPPYDKHKDDINIWAAATVSHDSGVDIAGEGVYLNTALNSGFYTFGIDRYLTTRDMKSIRDAVWNVPCDAIFVLVNSDKYGGGGMYNLYAIGTADNERTTYVFVHELGHSLAGLADEYFSKEVAYDDFYNLQYEPWEPNITTLVDFDSKWKDMIPKGTPVPTPEDGGHSVGLYEGGGYVSKGIYRPVNHCMMRDYHPFCPVCSKAIVRMIDYYCDREY